MNLDASPLCTYVGSVVATTADEGGRGGTITIRSDLWFNHDLPPDGARVRLDITYISPYTALIEDDQ